MRFFHPIFHHKEKITMADFTRLEAAIADLAAKVDVLLAKQTPPVDEQPAVDQAAAAVEAIVAKMPA